MRVVCDQCASTYKVPNEKLDKPINKATCRQCGSRLLIPKPQQGADPDERVVVPAIPPTQGVADAGLVTPGQEDDDDKTVPVVRRGKRPAVERDDVALVAGAPITGADRAVLARARSAPATPPQVAPAPPPAAPAPPPTAPAAAQVAPELPPTPQAAPAVAPAPAPAPGAGKGLVLAAAGMGAAILGVALAGAFDAAVPVVVGLLLAFCGGITALMVLAFGNLGRGDGRPLISALGGLGLGVPLTLLVALARFGLPEVSFPADRQPAVATAPTPAPAPAADEVADADEAVADAEEPPVEVASVAAPPPARPAPREEPAKASAAVTATRTPAPRAEPAPPPAPAPQTARTAPAPAPAPRPAAVAPPPIPDTERAVLEPEPDPAPAPLPPPDRQPVREPVSGSPELKAPSTDGLMATVPREVIHTIISTNVGVKECFFSALRRDREIAPPITVSTTFNLAASGSASNLRINNPELKGSRLERCLDGTFRSLSFPPSAKGGPVTYPFKIGG